MIKKCKDINSIITRKEIDFILTRYMKYVPKKMRNNMMDNMMEMKLLERVSRDKMKIINKEKSDIIEHDLFLSDMEEGKSWW